MHRNGMLSLRLSSLKRTTWILVCRTGCLAVPDWIGYWGCSGPGFLCLIITTLLLQEQFCKGTEKKEIKQKKKHLAVFSCMLDFSFFEIIFDCGDKVP